MKKEYNSLELRLMFTQETDVITASGDNSSEDNDIIGGDIF